MNTLAIKFTIGLCNLYFFCKMHIYLAVQRETLEPHTLGRSLASISAFD